MPRKISKARTPFGAFLESCAHRNGYKTSITRAKLMGISTGFLTEIVSGERTPPPERIDEWAKALSLDPRERDKLNYLAMLDHLPAAFRADMARLIDRVEKLKPSK